jgi:hypothetical protein
VALSGQEHGQQFTKGAVVPQKEKGQNFGIELACLVMSSRKEQSTRGQSIHDTAVTQEQKLVPGTCIPEKVI